MPGISRDSKIDELEAQFHSLVKKYDFMYKPEVIRINISSTFIVRTKCVECGSGPNYYYYTRKPTPWFDVKQYQISSERLRSYIKRMTSDWYLESDPKYFHDIQEFSFTVDDKHYLPIMHRARGFVYGGNVVELVGCDCGATTWAFNQKSVKNRPEITNRKGRYKYPQKLEY